MAIPSFEDYSDYYSGLYRAGIDRAMQYMDADTLDGVEIGVSFVVSAALGVASSLPMTNVACRILWSLGCGILGMELHERFIKKGQVERAIQEVVETSKGRRKSALMIHSTKDHNGAFSKFHCITQVYKNCARKHEIDRIRGLTREERRKVSGREYDVVALFAHGYPQGIAMDDKYLVLGGASSKRKMDFLSRRVKEGGKIILAACSTGQGDDNIAKAISLAAPHATVYASSDFIYLGIGEKFDKNMTPAFNNGSFCFRKDTTRTYRNGELIKN
jgi:hypothetical protein